MKSDLVRRGRPKTFDSKKALDEAVLVFWKHGFEGTSITDLTSAMGITPPTLYSAFGSKDNLYRLVLDRYYDFHGGRERAERFELQPDAFKAVQDYLYSCAEKLVGPQVPTGCMISTANLFHGSESVRAAELTAAMRAETAEMFIRKLAWARENGQLGRDVDIEELGAFYATVAQGLAVQSIDGRSLESMRSIIGIALKAWPGIHLDTAVPTGR